MTKISYYLVYDGLGEVIRKYDTPEEAKQFTHNRPDCRIEPVTVNLYELLGECLL